MNLQDKNFSSRRQQRTIKNVVALSGVGLFTGKEATIEIHPAPEDLGVVFERIDLPNHPRIPALVEYVFKTPRRTILKSNGIQIETVEHILSAIKAFEIDNLIIRVHGPEIPIEDGSAQSFVNLIESAGIICQAKHKEVYYCESPVFWSQGDVHLVALPSEEFRISYTLNYPNSELLKSQFLSLHIDLETYKSELALARTFSLYEEIITLIEEGAVKGGRLDNAVVIKGNKVLNPEGIRYSDEMVRHKILDLLGDLALVGKPFVAHIIAIRSGHFSNTSFAQELVNAFNVKMGLRR